MLFQTLSTDLPYMSLLCISIHAQWHVAVLTFAKYKVVYFAISCYLHSHFFQQWK